MTAPSHDERMTLQEAVREMDAVLRRWRSAAHPEYLVMPSDQFRRQRPGARVIILHEPTHFTMEALRETLTENIDYRWPELHFGAVAAEFFAAHPKVQPWHSAKPGELWLVDGAPRAVIARLHEAHTFADPFYRAPGFPVDSPSIREAHLLVGAVAS